MVSPTKVEGFLVSNFTIIFKFYSLSFVSKRCKIEGIEFHKEKGIFSKTILHASTFAKSKIFKIKLN